MGLSSSIMHPMLAADMGVVGWVGVLGLLGLVALIVRAVSSRGVLAIAKLTWKAAFRFRVFWVMAILLLVAVAGLPSMLKGDGTAEGLVQIIITYTLSMVFLFLGAGTLWMSAGSMANDIEDYHIQMIATKPIARWEIWLGKWIGVMSLNLVLLGLAGGTIYAMVEYRANKLTRDELKRMESHSDPEILLMAMSSRLPVLADDPETKQFIAAPKPQPLLAEAQGMIAAKAPQFMGFIQDFKNRNDGKEPLFRPISDIRHDVASLEEKELREKVLIGQARIELEAVLHVGQLPPRDYEQAPASQFKPLEEKYKGQREATLTGLIEEHLTLMQEQQQYYDRAGIQASLPTELTDDEVQTMKQRAELMLRLRSQVLNPSEGFVFVYDVPARIGLPQDELLHWQLEFEDPTISYKSANPYYIWAFAGNKLPPMQFGGEHDLTARTIHDVALAHQSRTRQGQPEKSSILEDADKLYIYLRNASDHQNVNDRSRFKSLKVPFLNAMTGELDPEKMQLLYRESGFAENFMRAMMILFAWLGVLAALGLFAASFMSFPMAAFACLGILVMSFCTGLMEDVLEDETIMQTYTMGERDSSVVDLYAIPAFKVITTLVSPMKDYSPIEALSSGQSVTWGETVRAYAFVWGISGWILGLVGAIVFDRRQLAITSSQAQ